MRVLIMGGKVPYEKKMNYVKLFAKHPELANHHKFYEMTPHEQ